VRLKSFCAEPRRSRPTGRCDRGRRAFTVTLGRPVTNGIAARLSGVATREAAEALRGQRLYVDRDRLPALPDDEFYHADLIGLEVRDTGGALLGAWRRCSTTAPATCWRSAPGEAAILLPFTREVVPTVDTGAGRIVADPPEGLIE
jgi:16S rRNA processing protein RimM